MVKSEKRQTRRYLTGRRLPQGGEVTENATALDISGMVVIAESHLSVHTWPEYCYAAADIFTLSEIIKPEVAARHLIERFESKNPSVVEMKRGILSHENIKFPHKFSPPELQAV